MNWQKYKPVTVTLLEQLHAWEDGSLLMLWLSYQVHIQNATLAGGVAIGTACNMFVYPWGALLIGALAGSLSTVGYVYVTVNMTFLFNSRQFINNSLLFIQFITIHLAMRNKQLIRQNVTGKYVKHFYQKKNKLELVKSILQFVICCVFGV